MRICLNCGYENDSGAKFCTECGRMLEEIYNTQDNNFKDEVSEKDRIRELSKVVDKYIRIIPDTASFEDDRITCYDSNQCKSNSKEIKDLLKEHNVDTNIENVIGVINFEYKASSIELFVFTDNELYTDDLKLPYSKMKNIHMNNGDLYFPYSSGCWRSPYLSDGSVYLACVYCHINPMKEFLEELEKIVNRNAQLPINPMVTAKISRILEEFLLKIICKDSDYIIYDSEQCKKNQSVILDYLFEIELDIPPESVLCYICTKTLYKYVWLFTHDSLYDDVKRIPYNLMKEMYIESNSLVFPLLDNKSEEEKSEYYFNSWKHLAGNSFSCDSSYINIYALKNCSSRIYSALFEGNEIENIDEFKKQFYLNTREYKLSTIIDEFINKIIDHGLELETYDFRECRCSERIEQILEDLKYENNLKFNRDDVLGVALNDDTIVFLFSKTGLFYAGRGEVPYDSLPQLIKDLSANLEESYEYLDPDDRSILLFCALKECLEKIYLLF